jgi:hypothetical protein
MQTNCLNGRGKKCEAVSHLAGLAKGWVVLFRRKGWKLIFPTLFA